MRYSEEDAKKAALIMYPSFKKYDTFIQISKSILEEDEDKKYYYALCTKTAQGRIKELGSFRNKDIRKALEKEAKRSTITYGYCRISRSQQSIERQIRNIQTEYPTAVVVKEAFTGTKMDRPEWNKLFKNVNSGDTIVFDSVSRMSRNADEGVETYFRLYEKGVQLIFLKEHYIDTSVYAENMRDKIELQGTDEDEIFKGLNNYFRKLAERQIRIAFEQAEKEVTDLHQRTKEGLITAKLNGKQIGQKPGAKLTIKKEAPAKEKIRKYSRDFAGTLSDSECIQLIGISRNTYYKYKKEIKNV